MKDFNEWLLEACGGCNKCGNSPTGGQYLKSGICDSCRGKGEKPCKDPIGATGFKGRVIRKEIEPDPAERFIEV